MINKYLSKPYGSDYLIIAISYSFEWKIDIKIIISVKIETNPNNGTELIIINKAHSG